MALEKALTKGTGKAGHRSSRWAPRADVKASARKRRRRDDRKADMKED